jgi:hypothetical protein
MKKKINEVAPSGWEGTVKAMKKHKEIDNPWALAWSMKKKGYKSHKSEKKKKKNEQSFLLPTFSEWLSENHGETINENWSNWWNKHKTKIIAAGIGAATIAGLAAVSPWTNEYSVDNLGKRALYEKLWGMTGTPADFLASLPLPIRMAIGAVLGAGTGYFYGNRLTDKNQVN